MKWMVFVLALANVVVYLLSMKLEKSEGELVDVYQAKTINAPAMSVVKPGNGIDQNQSSDGSAVQIVEEEALTQLKIDPQGEALRKKNMPKELSSEVDSSSFPDISVKAVEEMDDVILVTTNAIESTSEQSDNIIPESIPAKIAQNPQESKLSKPKVVKANLTDSVDKTLACFRLGPFINQNNLATMRHQLEGQNINYMLDEANIANKIKSVRVYMGAFVDNESLNKQKIRLEEMGIEHFVIRINGVTLLQLGNFSEPARAKSYVLRLKARGITVRQEAIYGNTTIKSWLNIANISKAEVMAFMQNAKIKVKINTCP